MPAYRYFPATGTFAVIDMPLFAGYPAFVSGGPGNQIFVTRAGQFAYGPGFVAIFRDVRASIDCRNKRASGSGRLIDSFTQVALPGRQVLIVNGRTREVLASLLTDLQGRFTFSASFGDADIVQAVFQGDWRTGPAFSQYIATRCWAR